MIPPARAGFANAAANQSAARSKPPVPIRSRIWFTCNRVQDGARVKARRVGIRSGSRLLAGVSFSAGRLLSNVAGDSSLACSHYRGRVGGLFAAKGGGAVGGAKRHWSANLARKGGGFISDFAHGESARGSR